MEQGFCPLIYKETIKGTISFSGMGRPFGLTSDDYDFLYITDMDLHGIVKISPDHKTFQWLDSFKGWTKPALIRDGQGPRAQRCKPKRFNGPHSISITADNRLFITTYYSPGVHIVPYTGRKGEMLKQGNGAPVLTGPATGTLDHNERLLVAEYSLNGIFTFDTNGQFAGAVGGGNDSFHVEDCFPAGHKQGYFDRPHMCRETPDHDLIIVDTWNHRLQKISSTGKFISFLDGANYGWHTEVVKASHSNTSTCFHAPVAIGFAEDGRFVVTDWGNNRLQWFDPDGQRIKVEDDLGLKNPYDTQVLCNHCVIANSHRGQVLMKGL